ncbi:MAG: hypothetical protein HYZ91_02405 [Candidatus Omnitrophica bacterium]|nr:hypothetical protein [Candidatus Omnitrophota bacterium]
MSGSLEPITTELLAVASAIQERQPEAAMIERLATLERLCAAPVAQERNGAATPWLANVKTVLETWRQVWPRLGQDEEFRLAVAREARLWSKRLASLARRA